MHKCVFHLRRFGLALSGFQKVRAFLILGINGILVALFSGCVAPYILFARDASPPSVRTEVYDVWLHPEERLIYSQYSEWKNPRGKERSRVDRTVIDLNRVHLAVDERAYFFLSFPISRTIEVDGRDFEIRPFDALPEAWRVPRHHEMREKSIIHLPVLYSEEIVEMKRDEVLVLKPGTQTDSHGQFALLRFCGEEETVNAIVFWTRPVTVRKETGVLRDILLMPLLPILLPIVEIWFWTHPDNRF